MKYEALLVSVLNQIEMSWGYLIIYFFNFTILKALVQKRNVVRSFMDIALCWMSEIPIGHAAARTDCKHIRFV